MIWIQLDFSFGCLNEETQKATRKKQQKIPFYCETLIAGVPLSKENEFIIFVQLQQVS